MSRIDEALKRAAGTPATVMPGRGPRIVALDDYPVERPGDGGVTTAEPLPRPVEQPPRIVEVPRAHDAAEHDGAARDVVSRHAHRVRTGSVAVSRPGSIDLTRSGSGQKLVSVGGANGLSVEQYRRLAAVLDQAQAERNFKCLMISSALPRDGKTLTATNVALTLAESYRRRVLLIDADLRRPSVHEVLGLANHSGLAESLRSERAVPYLRVSEWLSVLPGGHDPNPTDALASARMKTLVDEAVATFDWVIVDTPPIGLLPDAQLVSRLVDGVLLVIAAGVTPYQLVQRAVTEIGPDRFIGTVLNRAAHQTVPMTDYYHGYYAAAEQS